MKAEEYRDPSQEYLNLNRTASQMRINYMALGKSLDPSEPQFPQALINKMELVIAPISKGC